MLKSQIILAIRHLKKESAYSLVSIACLALAFATAFMASGYAVREFSPDTNFAELKRLYRLNATFTATEDKVTNPQVHIEAGLEVLQQVPEVEQVVALLPVRGTLTIEYGGRTYKVNHSVLTNAQFSSLLDPTLFTNTSALKPGTMALSKTQAEAIFGGKDPHGEVVKTSAGDFTVAGLFSDFPSNSHLTINAAAVPLDQAAFLRGSGYVYARLAHGSDEARVFKKMEQRSAELEELNGPFLYSLESAGELYAQGHHGFVINGINRQAVNTLLVISIIVLLVSVTNVVHYTQLKCLYRGREVGVKKVLGIGRKQLAGQFFVESSVLTGLALLLGLSIVQLVQPDVYAYLGSDIPDGRVALPATLGIALVVIALLTLGQYYLFTGVMPRRVIVGDYKLAGKKHLLRVMVGAQFLIATVLMGGGILAWKQMQFIANLPMGFEEKGLWFLHAGDSAVNLRILKGKLANIPGIVSSSLSSAIPGVQGGYRLFSYHAGGQQQNLLECEIDADFIDTYKLKYAEAPVYQSPGGFLTNQAGKQFHEEAQFHTEKRPMLGVVENFHLSKVTQPILPLRLVFGEVNQGYLTIRIEEGKESVVEEALRQEWETMFPAAPFELKNLKQSFIASHKSVAEQMAVVNGLTLLALFIFTIGLAAVASFSVRRKLKEVAIRKVLGASLVQIAQSVNIKYFAVTATCSLMAMPLLQWLGSRWLDNFAYHTELSMWLVVTPAAVVVGLAALIMLVQTWKTAMANPVDSLRTE